MFKYGVEVLLKDTARLNELKKHRVALLGHPASVDQELNHSLDLLKNVLGDSLTAVFGPQHGMRGEKQDNMIESDDYVDPVYKMPVFSLYGKVRRPTDKMLESFDILLIDLQDVGCRIYTFLTTLFYMIDAVAEHPEKQIWVLDRPNPAGRNVEGHLLNMDFASFVGAAPVPMRHGLTLGEAGRWYIAHKKYEVNYKVVSMQGYSMETREHGWPSHLSWVNPSPNMPRLSCVRQYAGSVLIEGTYLSEGRGTTIPLEVVGAPRISPQEIIETMRSWAPQWLEGTVLRSCFYEPTFHKFKGELCAGIQVHVDGDLFDYERFQPYRLYCLLLKAIRQVHPEFQVWKQPPYEYEEKLMPIDILSGDTRLRTWADSSSSDITAFEKSLKQDEEAWLQERKPFLLYDV